MNQADSHDQQETQWWKSGEEYHKPQPKTPDLVAPPPPNAAVWFPPSPQPGRAATRSQWSAPGERRFYAVATITGAPVFIVFCAVVARFAIPDRGGRVFGIAAAVFGLLLLVFLLRVPYAAIVRSDGTLTFKGLTGSTTTQVSRVNRITVYTGGRGGSMWYFYYDGGRTRLGDVGGRALARYLIGVNPAIDYPRSLTRWWGSPL